MGWVIFLLYAVVMILALFVYTATETFTASDDVLSSNAFCDFLTHSLISHLSMHVYILLIPQRHGGACWPVGKGGHHQLHPRKGPGWSCRRIYHWTQGTHQPPQTEVATLPLLQQSPSACGRWSQQGVLSTIKFIVMETQISRAIVLLLKM